MAAGGSFFLTHSMGQRKQMLFRGAGFFLVMLSALRLQAGTNDPDAVSDAFAWARSPLASDHARLQHELEGQEFYSRLDSTNLWRGPRKPGALFHILQTLSTNQVSTARQVLLTLTRDDGFNRDPDRTDALILACASVRPAPPELVAFWDNHCRPDDGFTPLTIAALVENASDPALALFESKMLSDSFSEEDKTDWMRSSVLTHRDTPPLLRSCEKLLHGSLSPKLRPALVQVLFDYRPAEWFPPDNVISPPDRAHASPEARALLRNIGAWALQNLALTAVDQAAIRRTLAGLKP